MDDDLDLVIIAVVIKLILISITEFVENES